MGVFWGWAMGRCKARDWVGAFWQLFVEFLKEEMGRDVLHFIG